MKKSRYYLILIINLFLVFSLMGCFCRQEIEVLPKSLPNATFGIPYYAEINIKGGEVRSDSYHIKPENSGLEVSANLNMAAKQDIKIDSVDGELTVTASEQLTLMCGGSYIKISSEGIELGTQDNVYLKCNVMQKMGAASNDLSAKLNNNDSELEMLLRKHVSFNSKSFSE
ncbi:hypothetical protein A9G34_04630 [Gilliamella sp. Choc4-2]|uniref:DUF2345 domain-containing protein n=1 Tax=unclassified Gilliamella TaxID=2685620 RepID=UPI00080DEB4C|nr:DUF2345 domain-containing protein [Gilliamella apicola]OCG29442.1 hypothetical protein A9G33_09735 [Gilliamella apicola]OCG46677.1 hypothetical protein A9G34_04630 [Gilliamella apicola]